METIKETPIENVPKPKFFDLSVEDLVLYIKNELNKPYYKNEMFEKLTVKVEDYVCKECKEKEDFYRYRNPIIWKQIENNNIYKKISSLNFSTRVKNCFKNNNIEYLGDLVQYSEAKLLRSPNFGRGSLKEVKECLIKHDLDFDMIISRWRPSNINELSETYDV